MFDFSKIFLADFLNYDFCSKEGFNYYISISDLSYHPSVDLIIIFLFQTYPTTLVLI